jgi:hypothetical protein
MGVANWMRVLDTVSGLARIGGRIRATLDPAYPDVPEPAARDSKPASPVSSWPR